MGIFLAVFWMVVIVFIIWMFNSPRRPVKNIEDDSNYSHRYGMLVCETCRGSGEVYQCSNMYETWHKSSKLSDFSSEHHSEDLCCAECLNAGKKYTVEEYECTDCNGTGKYQDRDVMNY